MSQDDRGLRMRPPVRGEVDLPAETRAALDEGARRGTLSLAAAVAGTLCAIAFVVVVVTIAITFDIRVAGAVVATAVGPALAILGVVWRARRGPRRLDKALRRYLTVIHRHGLTSPEYHYSAQWAETARGHLKAGHREYALGAVHRSWDSLATVQVDPSVHTAMRTVVLCADDMANPTTGRWTPGLAVFIGAVLLGIVGLPVLVGEVTAVPMVAVAVAGAVLGGVGCRYVPKTYEWIALAGPILLAVVLSSVFDWPDVLNLGSFIGVIAGGIVGMYLRDREATQVQR